MSHNNMETLKALIELSSTFDEANEILEQFVSKNLYDKINFLQGVFRYEIVHKTTKDEYVDYVAALTAIVSCNMRYRRSNTQ